MSMKEINQVEGRSLFERPLQTKGMDHAATWVHGSSIQNLFQSLLGWSEMERCR